MSVDGGHAPAADCVHDTRVAARDALLDRLHDARVAAEDRAREAQLLLLRVALRLDVVPVSGLHGPEFVARRVQGWVERSGL